MAKPPTLFHPGNRQVAAAENSVRPWELTGGAMKTGLAGRSQATLARSPGADVPRLLQSLYASGDRGPRPSASHAGRGTASGSPPRPGPSRFPARRGVRRTIAPLSRLRLPAGATFSRLLLLPIVNQAESAVGWKPSFSFSSGIPLVFVWCLIELGDFSGDPIWVHGNGGHFEAHRKNVMYRSPSLRSFVQSPVLPRRRLLHSLLRAKKV